MEFKNSNKELEQQVKRNVRKINEAKKGKSTLLAQTVYLGTLGFVFVLPIIAGAYLGVWLDEKIKGYSISWTINLILLGVIIGAINVYLLIKD
ncbi:TPA: AtpZ/AtpI family protein [Legionella pneumophila]|uniref:F0F1-ATPase subunit (ATPase_gene1) n=3 Tax=Legionella TaxID=445 RepID=A0A222P319_9GAMM|nr:AtpZ/AtpI family protein [Legionella pneumophila]ASQ46221.1 Putative F0F1-ATPase subunit (ATPase_gene1) [Legionella clemsonensis]WBV62267.1 AtpZ/AtpI family protein [Legionella pneumophila 130b]AAU27138.1 ATP synthase, putative [Legionella pneumophila subsp. pneumophila str. Philadelphia 1]AGH54227.1 ATP synthase protein I [Legionella pneumophila subsp. pneumophila LPE509]AMV13799.1 Putative F0F1-ATPase subunit [Legionella pneumophila]